MLRIANNCEEQNLVACLVHDGQAIVVKTIKPVIAGEELKVWPSLDILTLLSIPFLLPKNILGYETYKCIDCNTTFTQPNPLKIHISFDCPSKAIFATPISSNTSICGSSFIANTSLASVQTKEPKTHVCIYCGKLYTRKYGLKIHLRTHTGYKPLQCRVCNRPFSDPSNLNKHIRLHLHRSVSGLASPYKCRICFKVLVRRRDLERHLKSRHNQV